MWYRQIFTHVETTLSGLDNGGKKRLDTMRIFSAHLHPCAFPAWRRRKKSLLNFKVYLSASTNRKMCCFPPFFFFLEPRSISTPSATSGGDRWEENRGVWIRLDMPTQHVSEPGAGRTHPSVWISANPKCENTAGKAIWDIDNEINTKKRAKEAAVCTRYAWFKWQRTSWEKAGWKGGALYLSGCISVCSFHCVLTAKARQTEITTTEIRCLNWEKRDLLFHCSVCLFWRPVWQRKSTFLSEYKRCLRGNISEVLCWWLTAWQTSGWSCDWESGEEGAACGGITRVPG